MTPYSIAQGYIPQEVFDQFKMMRDFVENLPDIEGEVITCHAICRVLAGKYPDFLEAEGTFGDIYTHSWLVCRMYPKIILDMYPVAGASSFIVWTGAFLLPWFRLYKKEPITYDQVVLERQVQKILAI